MHLNIFTLAPFVLLVDATHLSLNGGSVKQLTCGLDCISGLDCSQNSVDSFAVCVASRCDTDDLSIAPAVEKLMADCHYFAESDVNMKSIDELKSLYVSSQLAIFKRQTADNSTAGSTNGSSGNSSSNSTGGTGTGGSASGTQTGTYATSCSSVADVVDGTCIVRSTGAAAQLTRNSVVAFFGAALLAAFAL